MNENLPKGGDSMKKWFAIVLASTMILSISTAALAVEPNGCPYRPGNPQCPEPW